MTPRVAILSPLPLLGRTIGRTVTCGGGEAKVVSSPEQLGQLVQEGQVDLVCAGAEALGEVLPLVDPAGPVRLLVWYSDRVEPVLEAVQGDERVCHLFGLRYPDAPPRAWELLNIVRRWADRQLPPRDASLEWGASRLERVPVTDKDRDAVVGEVEQFVGSIAGRRPAGTMSEVAHELLMNAMYDAPVDASGTPLYAHDRTASIELAPEQRPRFLCGSDGSRLVLSVTDPFGRLRREHVFGGIYRGLASGTMDQSGGGAGLGMMVIFNASTLLFFDVVPGVQSQATAVLELDVPPRELRSLPRSIHFFRQEP